MYDDPRSYHKIPASYPGYFRSCRARPSDSAPDVTLCLTSRPAQCPYCVPVGPGHVCHHPGHDVIIRQSGLKPPDRGSGGLVASKGSLLLKWSAGRHSGGVDIEAILDVNNVRYVLDTDLVTVGRGPGNAIRLRDRSISWHHAEMLQTSMGTLIFDLLSTNGTYINGRRIMEKTLLENGDLLRFGNGVDCRYASREKRPPPGT